VVKLKLKLKPLLLRESERENVSAMSSQPSEEVVVRERERAAA